MPIKLVKCAVAVSGAGSAGSGGSTSSRTYMFLAPKGLYHGGISTATGITQLADDDADADEPIYKIEELIKARKLVRIVAMTQEGTVKRHIKMFCSKNKIGTIDDDLKDKTDAFRAVRRKINHKSIRLYTSVRDIGKYLLNQGYKIRENQEDSHLE